MELPKLLRTIPGGRVMDGPLAALVGNTPLCPPVIGVSGPSMGGAGSAPQTLLSQVMVINSGITNAQGEISVAFPVAFPNGLFAAFVQPLSDSPYAVIVTVRPTFSDSSILWLQFTYAQSGAAVVGGNLANFPQAVLAFGF